MAFRSLDPKTLTPSESYRILVNAIAPRPIALVSTLSADGIANLAPFSFFQVGGNNRPSLMFSPTNTLVGEEKDSLRNIRCSAEFCVCIVTCEMAEGVNASSAPVPLEESEWALSAFTQLPSEEIRPPRVAESPVHFECRLFRIIQHGGGPWAANYVIGEVVRFHLREDVAADPEAIRTIGRLGGDWYVDTAAAELFAVKRPSGSANRP